MFRTYRLAQSLDAAGFRGEAIEKLRSICARLEEADEPTPYDHWVRSAAPRILGVLLWEEARSIGGSPDANRTEILALLQEAVRFSRIAYDQQVFDDPMVPPEASEKVKAANNLVYFLVEYVEAGGQSTDEIDPARLRELLKEIGAAEPASLTNLTAADTARRVYAYLGDESAKLAAAEAVVKAFESWKAPVTPTIREAVRAAEATITSAPESYVGKGRKRPQPPPKSSRKRPGSK